jgi:hypothetical protein
MASRLYMLLVSRCLLYECYSIGSFIRLIRINRMEEMNQGAKVCNCAHHKVVPFSIILIGLVFLLGAFQVLSAMAVSVIWPILVIVIGVVKLKGRKCACCAR